MKKEYVTPMMTGQKFIANEYVNACWGVACDVLGSDSEPTYDGWGPNRKENNTHAANSDGTGCGHAANQYIVQTSTGFKMTEVNTSGQGDLDCTVVSYTDNDNNGLPDDGTTIYWNTYASAQGDNRVWHHQGTVNLNDKSRPNHS